MHVFRMHYVVCRFVDSLCAPRRLMTIPLKTSTVCFRSPLSPCWFAGVVSCKEKARERALALPCPLGEAFLRNGFVKAGCFGVCHGNGTTQS